MKTNKELEKWFCSILRIVLLIAVIGLPKMVFAIDVGEVEIHGYGHQAFMVTNENKYLGANDKGSWDYSEMSIVFTSKVADNTNIWIQIHGEDAVRLDWVFVDYDFNNNLSVQAGQVKLPMGFYNEVRDARFLQLSTMVPSMYRVEAELIHEAYRGVRAIYNLDLGGGDIVFEPIIGQLLEENMGHNQGPMLGGRITYHTPLDGLSLASATTYSKIEMDMMGNTMQGNMKMWYAGVEYVNYEFDLKSEYVWMKMFDKAALSYYAQAGYTFFDKLTPFVRYDYNTTDKDQDSNPLYYQKCGSVGVGYKINYNVALKAAYHINEGYALPAATGEVNAASGEDKWNMFVASINFIF